MTKKRTFFLPLIAVCSTLIPELAEGEVTIETAFVGDAGNSADSTGYGAVAYEYYIGTFEVTNAQYTAFLNAVAATDTHGLYNPFMGSNKNDYQGGILREGDSGNYTYSTRPNMAEKPVNFVSFFDAARFANWLTNGQPTGTQQEGTTETGMYDLGGVTNPASNSVTRQLDFAAGENGVAVASRNEWYKAAYYDPSLNSGLGGYYDYPTQSNSITVADANFTAGPGIGIGALTNVGTYFDKPSYYGTFDQGGNVSEWTDSIVSLSNGFRNIQGGSFADSKWGLRASSGSAGPPSTEDSVRGFRVSSLAPIGAENSAGMVNIPDPVIEAAIRDELGIPEGPISEADMAQLVSLDVRGSSQSYVGSLTGLEYAVNLEYIGTLLYNTISDLSPLAGLDQLKRLTISGVNGISDLSPLANLSQLERLSIGSGEITDLSPLMDLSKLRRLTLYGLDSKLTDVAHLSGLIGLTNLALSFRGDEDVDIDPLSNLSNLTWLRVLRGRISDLSPLSELGSLRFLDLRMNHLSDLTPIQNLSNLSRLILSRNQVDDISALLSNKGLDLVDLTHNKLYLAPGSPDQEVVDALRARGVTVQVENQNPDGPEYPTSGTPNLVPSDGSPVDSDPDQFGRTVGLSGTTVLVGAEANDDQGVDSGKAYLYLDPDTGNGPVVETIQIPASDPSELNNRFGSSVSLAGSLALIGAAGNNDFPTGPGQPEGTYSGAAFVYQNIDSAASGGHSPSAKLIRLADTRYGDLDQRADLSGTSALVSYFLEENEAGAAYLYRNLDSLSGTQTEVARLTASDGAGADASHPGDQFGFSIALESDLAIIGAPNASIESPVLPGTIISKAGAVYLFQGLDSATGEIQESAKIIEGPESDGANFGYAVALDKGNAVIGAPALSISGSDHPREGRVWFYRGLDDPTATSLDFMELANRSKNIGNQFGRNVALSDAAALVWGEAETEFQWVPSGSDYGRLVMPDAGVAYIYLGLDDQTGPDTKESLQIFPSSSNPTGGTAFAAGMDLDGDRFAIGDFLAAQKGGVYYGQLSSYSTLDIGDEARVLDGLSFRSFTDWIIGENTSLNEITLAAGNSATVTTEVIVGANAGADDNRLIIGGKFYAPLVTIGSLDGNTGNVLEILSTANVHIGTIRIYPGNGLVVEGEFSTLEAVLEALGSPNLEVWDGTAWVEPEPTSDESPIEIVDGQTSVNIPSPGSGGDGPGDGDDSGSGDDHPDVAKADFSIQSITLDPQPDTTGQGFAATIVIRNQGDRSGDAGLLRFWVARATVPSFGETSSSVALQVGEMEPGTTKTVSIPSGLSAPTVEGTYHARAVIDADGITDEYSTGNNFGSVTYTVFAGSEGDGSGGDEDPGDDEDYPDWAKADFSIQSVTLDPQPDTTGQDFAATIVIKNQGDRSGDAGLLRFWVARATVPSFGETSSSVALQVGEMEPGATKTVSIDSGLAAPVEEGTYHARAVIDADGITDEYSTGNNFGSATYTVFAGSEGDGSGGDEDYPDWAKADFSIQSVTIDPKPDTISQEFTATVIIKNQGDRAADAGLLRVWAAKADQPTFGEGGGAAFEAAIGILAAGESKTVSIDSGLAAPVEEGTYHARAVIDADGITDEYSTGNNFGSATYTVFKLIPDWMKPDLVVQSVHLSTPHPKNLVEEFSATVTVSNEGDLASPSTELSIWQASPQYQVVGSPDATIQLSGLEPGETVELNLDGLSTPNEKGTFHLRVFVNRENNFEEYSFGNNHGGATYTVFAPRLKITRLESGDILLEWPGRDGRTYTVERTTGSPLGTYKAISDPLEGSPPENQFTDTDVPATGPVFYRVVVE